MFNNFELRENFFKFLNIYKDRPIKRNFSGIRIEHAFALFTILRKIKPHNIIESGVYKGMSTWIIEKALPNSKIFCIEPNLKKIEYFSKKAQYFQKDIALLDWSHLEKDKTLIFFDDHICFSKRINFLKKNQFKHIVFDDNLPSSAIGYLTPRSIIDEIFINPKKRVNYIYISRLFKFFIKFYFTENNKFTKYLFKKKYIEFHFKEYEENTILECKKFKKNISNYYEFPPLVKFDGKKRFLKHIRKYDLDYGLMLGNIADPIFDKHTKELEEYENELGIQYGNFCYFAIS